MNLLTPETIQEFLDKKASNGLSQATLRAYESDLDELYRACRVPQAAHPHIFSWEDFESASRFMLNSWRTTLAAATICRRLATYRQFGKHWKQVILEDYKPPKPAPPRPHPVPEGVDGVMRMIASTRSKQHKALLALTGLMGLRVSEAVNVKISDITSDSSGMWLRINGKGSKMREVPISDTVLKLLEPAWTLALVSHKEYLVGKTERGARAAITRHAKNAGLGHVASHDMRSTFATVAYEKTHDLRTVQELLGHADSKTTQRYTQVSTRAMRAATNAVI